MFLFTDNQIANERFFVFFNDLLASGDRSGSRENGELSPLFRIFSGRQTAVEYGEWNMVLLSFSLAGSQSQTLHVYNTCLN